MRIPSEARIHSLNWLGATLKAMRGFHNMTQTQLCANDINPTGPSEPCVVSRIENAKQRPSAYLLDSLLGKMDEPTFPWGYLFCINGLDYSVAKQTLREELRAGVLSGKIRQLYTYYTGKQPSDPPDEKWEDSIPELIGRCNDLGKKKDHELFIDFIEKYYLEFPFMPPEEIIEAERLMITNLRSWKEANKLKALFLPNETEKQIITDIALRYMDISRYDLALEIFSCLLQKKYTARIQNSEYWRIISVYQYNMALCYLLSGLYSPAYSSFEKGFYAMNYGGDGLTQMFYKALHIRLLRIKDPKNIHDSVYSSLKLDCSIQKTLYGFAFSPKDLIDTNRGLPVF